MIEINLLASGRKKRGAKGGGFALPDFKALAGLAKDPWLIAAVATWVVVGLLLLTMYLPRRHAVAQLEPRLEAAKAEAARLAQVLAIKRQFEARRDSVIREMGIIRQIDRDRYVWPHVLDQVTKALPPYTWLDDVVSKATEGDSAGGMAFQISGKSADIQAVTRFIRNLEESPFIQDVATVGTGTVMEQGREVSAFVLNAHYQVPDSTLLNMRPLAATLVHGVRSGGGARVR